jgi:hypothetical protein
MTYYLILTAVMWIAVVILVVASCDRGSRRTAGED